MTRAPRALPSSWGPLRWAFFLMESQEEEALNSHKALLQLGRNRDGRLQLVTTNFDRLFHLASQNDKTLEFASYGACCLSPKKITGTVWFFSMDYFQKIAMKLD